MGVYRGDLRICLRTQTFYGIRNETASAEVASERRMVEISRRASANAAAHIVRVFCSCYLNDLDKIQTSVAVVQYSWRKVCAVNGAASPLQKGRRKTKGRQANRTAAASVALGEQRQHRGENYPAAGKDGANLVAWLFSMVALFIKAGVEPGA